MEKTALVILLALCAAAAPVLPGFWAVAPEDPVGAATSAVRPAAFFAGGTPAFAERSTPSAQEEGGKDRLPRGLVAPAVVGWLFYWLVHLAAYLFFGLVLLFFLGLMLLLGFYVMRSRWRSPRALAAVIALTVAGTAAILWWTVHTFTGGIKFLVP